MIQKHPRIKNPKLLTKIKKEVGCCEYCGSHFLLETAHIIAKGMGGGKGPDIRENIVILCSNCHREHHEAKISDKTLFQLAGRRERMTGEECRIITRQSMGYDVC